LSLHALTIRELENRWDTIRRAHFKEIESDELDEDDIIITIIALIVCSDISNEVRNIEISSRWAQLVSDEFKQQVKVEEEEGQKPFIEKSSLDNIPQEQINFIENLCIPLYSMTVDIFPKMRKCLDQMNENIEKWSTQISHEKISHPEPIPHPQEENKDLIIPTIIEENSQDPPRQNSIVKSHELKKVRSVSEKPKGRKSRGISVWEAANWKPKPNSSLTSVLEEETSGKKKLKIIH